MIIRKPIDHNRGNMIVVASGNKVLVIDKSKMLLKVAENAASSQLGGGSSLTGED